ncbi:uncharacterized protein LOC112269449 [Brachypodium distachyon]|uniref:uncharacterized protein LOC112269449 n=1 Tax=Brachypodium distachyon TaxID=15368 RepID=UPI000D0DD467|nr:uncharacterized protein LOC112269449 [Brachypodium distachyon]XP_024311975.1 uncharacterized protein LOC112269449 [Brachypodium distachyon]|eukprot:XP_024311974.1 uncharacterized protein LOC112269449 [Brachypodium distachyon]
MADRCAATPYRCCLPWQDLLFGCLGALWRRRAEAELLGGGHTTCLCGHAILTLPCGHSWHERQAPRFSRCPICRGRARRREGEDDGRSWPVYSAAAAIDEQEPLVLLPPPPSRFVLARGKDEEEKEQPPSPSSVWGSSGTQEQSSSMTPPS